MNQLVLGENVKFKTFDELVDQAARDIHSALLKGGGQEMRSSVHLWLSIATQWNKKPVKPKRKDDSFVRGRCF